MATRPASATRRSLQASSSSNSGSNAAHQQSVVSRAERGGAEDNSLVGGGGEEMEDEPASAEEILKMALHLGMDPANDEALLWIAAEAYDAPLPDPWTEHFDWEGRVYFYNANTDAVTRDHPLDDFYRELYKAYKNHGAVAASKLGDAQMRAVAAAAAAANAAATANTKAAAAPAAESTPAPASNDEMKELMRTMAENSKSMAENAKAMAESSRNPLAFVAAATAAAAGTGLPNAPPALNPADIEKLLNSVATGDSSASAAANDLTNLIAQLNSVNYTSSTMVGDVAAKDSANEAAVTVLKDRLEKAEAAANAAQEAAAAERSNAALQSMADRLARAEESAKMAADLALEERRKAERVMQQAVEAAAASQRQTSGSDTAAAAAVEQAAAAFNRDLLLMQERVAEKEREAAQSKAALDAEREKMKYHEQTNDRIEQMLMQMRAGTTDLDSRIASFQSMVNSKEEERKAAEVERVKAQESVRELREQQLRQEMELRGALDAEKRRAAELENRVTNLIVEKEKAVAEAAQLAKQEAAAAAAAVSASGSGKVPAGFAREMARTQMRVRNLRESQRDAADQMYALNSFVRMKLEQASRVAAQMANAVKEKENEVERYRLAVQECDARMGPLVAEKRKLFNALMMAKGNIRVFCRVRPPSERELAQIGGDAFTFPEDNNNHRLCTLRKQDGGKKLYEYDRVFRPAADQEEVFADVQPLVQSVMDGYNVCIFAYGQTGSGKTYTMEGVPDNRGVTYRSFEELFKVASESWGVYKYEFKVCMTEIYNETVRDLLVKKGTDNSKHEIKQDEDGFTYVTDLTYQTVGGPKEFVEVMSIGSKNRSVGATKMNDRSSRSHLVMAIIIEQTNTAKNTKKVSKLSLVDLAGSERLSKTEAEGERLKESLHINKSLSALGDVISALTSKKGHVPFRNSKLTHMLSDSLGNDSKTLLFVNASPVLYNAQESSCSLDFATRARNVDLSGGVGGAQMVKKWREAAMEAQQLQRRNDDQMRSLEDEVMLLRHAKDSAEKEIKNLETRMEDSKTLSEKNTNINGAEVTKLQGELDRLRVAKDEAEKRLADATGRTAELQRELQQLKAQTSKAAAAPPPPPQSSATQNAVAEKLAQANERVQQLELELRQQRAAATSSTAAPSKGAGGADNKEVDKLKEQVAALTDINRQLLEKCKAAKEENRKLVSDQEQSSTQLRAMKAKHAGTLRRMVSAATSGDGAARPGSSGERKAGVARSKGTTPR